MLVVCVSEHCNGCSTSILIINVSSITYLCGGVLHVREEGQVTGCKSTNRGVNVSLFRACIPE